MEWNNAADIEKSIRKIVTMLSLSYIDCDKITCYRSFGSTSKAQARIWSLPRVWQQALSLPAHYIIEVISPRFDNLSKVDQEKTLIHELLHIPKNFSGSLIPHRRKKWRLSKEAEKLFSLYNDYNNSR